MHNYAERLAKILLRNHEQERTFTVSFLEADEASAVRAALEQLRCTVETDLPGTLLTVECQADVPADVRDIASPAC